MDKIKIVHIAQAEGAGVTEYIKMLAERIELKRYECVLIGSTYYERERSYFEERGWTLYTICMIREIKPIQDIQSMIKLRKLLKKLNPQIIHIHSSKAGILGRIAALGMGSKVIYNAHGWAFNMKVSKKKQWVYSKAEKLLSCTTDKIINISVDEYKTALAEGISEKKMIVIKNAIEIDSIKDYDKKSIFEELNIPEEAYVIGICGRIAEQKSPEIFIEVCSKMMETIPKAYFLMIGEGELRKDTMALAQVKGIEDRLRITGWTNEPNQYISILDVALLTSKWEGFGLVLLQYMLYKKPVIASNVGGIPEIVRDGVTGYLVDWNDTEAYCTRIRAIYENPVAYEVIVQNAYNMVKEEYSLARLVEEHDKLYNEMA